MRKLVAKCKTKLVLFSLFAINLIDQPTPPIEIEQGILTGIVNADGTILEYIGIPYGVFNSSNLFQAPYPPPKWKGTYKATQETSCPHFFLFKTWGEIDCLKVNIYVPVEATKPLAVMVFIHGGGFTYGNGGKLLYGPEFLVKHSVILVTFNNRLDILGFLCLGIKEAPGNAALRDQIAALKWIKKNIAAFGGDPDNITIFGQSAGGVAASLLHASNATNGLFNKVIVQSGSSFASWVLNINPVWIASAIAKELGFDTKDPHELYEIFSKTPYEDYLGIRLKRPYGKVFDTQLMHLPCIERKISGVETIADDLPYNLIRKYPKHIPVIYSTLDQEGLFMFYYEDEQKLEEKKYLHLFASDLEFASDEKASEVAKEVRNFYFDDKEYSMELADNISDFATQLYFEVPTILESETILEHSRAPVYNLFFKYSGGRNMMKYAFRYLHKKGACHGDDLMYLFKGQFWPRPQIGTDQVIIDQMTELWTNFAKYSDPTPVTSKLPIQWEPSVKGNMKFLYVDEQMKMGPIPNVDGYNLWKNIYQKHRRKNLEIYLP
ncbi:hypothetical protein O0L34_g16143 [Tuta absoluta]|nr:hypothetical protein O0L34_g16143 [Tuta absoluta]